jgi:2-amino-4-hydroxy-6-hydroxymethyldihydropteridine diphosphokinase
MPTCLLGLGSNLGESEATLASAVGEITALPDLQLVRHSKWHRTPPVGGPPGQAEFFNGAAVVETTIPPLTLLAELQQIESRHGRVRGERWAPRTLDIDVLIYGNEVSETPMLTLPHARLTFRIGAGCGNRAENASPDDWLADRAFAVASAHGKRPGHYRVAEPGGARTPRRRARREAQAAGSHATQIRHGRSLLATVVEQLAKS